jgi:alpha-1,3-mannosyl-glycoprotein beta-1,2-N-acetylglucosaminyltransferase
MICFQRAEYLERSLKALKRAHPASIAVAAGEVAAGVATGPSVVISQDGNHGGVSKVISEFKATMARELPAVSVVHLKHPQGRGETGYHLLAQHYKFALGSAFDLQQQPAVNRVVVLEEDLEVSPDAFEYFAATVPLLDDPSENLLCVSAWNDNGQASHVSDPAAVYRSSFFPGLGWMLNKKLWLELGPKWPKAYWDDWLREYPQQKGREVLRPEVCRTYHFATKGVSNNQFSAFLTDIAPSRDPPHSVGWRTKDLTFLHRRLYDAALKAELSAAQVVSLDDARRGKWPSGGGAVRVDYGAARNFERAAQRLGIMDNVKAGCPRVAYHGVVTVRLGPDKRKVHVSLPLAEVFNGLSV